MLLQKLLFYVLEKGAMRVPRGFLNAFNSSQGSSHKLKNFGKDL